MYRPVDYTTPQKRVKDGSRIAKSYTNLQKILTDGFSDIQRGRRGTSTYRQVI